MKKNIFHHFYFSFLFYSSFFFYFFTFPSLKMFYIYPYFLTNFSLIVLIKLKFVFTKKGVVKPFELAKFNEKLVFSECLLDFWLNICHYGFQNSQILTEIFSLGLHQIGDIVWWIKHLFKTILLAQVWSIYKYWQNSGLHWPPGSFWGDYWWKLQIFFFLVVVVDIFVAPPCFENFAFYSLPLQGWYIFNWQKIAFFYLGKIQKILPLESETKKDKNIMSKLEKG